MNGQHCTFSANESHETPWDSRLKRDNEIQSRMEWGKIVSISILPPNEMVSLSCIKIVSIHHPPPNEIILLSRMKIVSIIHPTLKRDHLVVSNENCLHHPPHPQTRSSHCLVSITCWSVTRASFHRQYHPTPYHIESHCLVSNKISHLKICSHLHPTPKWVVSLSRIKIVSIHHPPPNEIISLSWMKIVSITHPTLKRDHLVVLNENCLHHPPHAQTRSSTSI